MDKGEITYESLRSVSTTVGMEIGKALEVVARLVDMSILSRNVAGLEHALALCHEMQQRQVEPVQLSTLRYYAANAHSGLRAILGTQAGQEWTWEQDAVDNEIILLRLAAQEPGFTSQVKIRQCQILTNLGNLMSHIGRFVEAVEFWDKALEIHPSFGMALGNRGYCRFYYAMALHENSTAMRFLKDAYIDLKRALSLPLEGNAGDCFRQILATIVGSAPSDYLDSETTYQERSLGRSHQESEYRAWCLERRLFLNPMNDLGAHPVAASDTLMLPGISVPISEGPYYLGYFNQMKQEFVSARYLLYQGTKTEHVHFSDRRVDLVNTLDYPAYSLSLEQMKAAFRMAYSLLDKVAFFLNHYLSLSIPERRISFKTLWYEKQRKDSGLRAEFTDRRNWPLRGLFWLSKDMYEDKPGFRESIDPDAQDISTIRNHLEHKYLKLHEDFWVRPSEVGTGAFRGLVDTLAFSVRRDDFERKCVRLVQIVRAALIYLALAVHGEETERDKSRPDSISSDALFPAFLDRFRDEWKV